MTTHYSVAELSNLIEAAEKACRPGSRESPALIVRGRSPNSVNPIARPVVPSCWRAWLHLARLGEERGDLPGYLLEFVDLAVGGDEVLE